MMVIIFSTRIMYFFFGTMLIMCRGLLDKVHQIILTQINSKTNGSLKNYFGLLTWMYVVFPVSGMHCL